MIAANKVISLFSGAGGMDIGFEAAGFKTAVMVEKDTACCQTLRANMPGVPVLCGDITGIGTHAILGAAGLSPLEPALVIGGPPCQPFSLAGGRQGLDDSRGRLILEFVRVVREALPHGFVMENVPGLLSWGKGKAMRLLMEEMGKPVQCGGTTYRYATSHKVLDAADYGVPQHRKRVFITGNRLGGPFRFPGRTHGCARPYVTVGDALGGLPPAREPSAAAKRVAGTIKKRAEKHGY